jgi:hypothetical protein
MPRRAFHGWPGPAATARALQVASPCRGSAQRGLSGAGNPKRIGAACGEKRARRGRKGASPGGRRSPGMRRAVPLRNLAQALCRASGEDPARLRDAPFAQAPDHPRTRAVGAEPCPAPASSRSAGSLLRQPRSALAARRPRLASRRRPRRHATPTARRPRWWRRRAQTVGAGLERHPFSGPADSVGGLLHTP